MVYLLSGFLIIEVFWLVYFETWLIYKAIKDKRKKKHKMTKIKYVYNKDKKLDAGDFVSVTSAEYTSTNFAIVALRGPYWTVVNLCTGIDYGRWDTVEKMTYVLGLERITQPFTVYPESEDDDD